MARLTRQAQGQIADAQSLRLRAAWLYYNRGLTQKDIAATLGVSRSSVIRLLEEARRRSEVQIWITPTPGDCTDLALALEETYGLSEAIVVPGHGTPEQTAADVGAALGRFLSEVVADGMTIGVGWGRTLSASLHTFRPPHRTQVRIVSLLGGLIEARTVNPADVAWQMASLIGADCLLFPAPLIVDSAETRRRLIEACGLDRLMAVARGLDLAVISCGDIGSAGTSLSQGFLTAAVQRELVAAGAICDTICQFLTADGTGVAHPIQDRVMSVGLDAVAAAGHVVLASGGARRAAAIRAALLRTGAATLITDEAAARALLALAPASPPAPG